MSDLYNELNNLDIHLSKNPHNFEAQAKREQIKMKLEVADANKARAAQVRSRIKWTEDGERSTKYFLGLEKTRANSKLMDQVKDEQGNLLTNQNDIQRRQRQYFANLYTKNIDDKDINKTINDFLHGCNVPQLLQNQRETCDRPLTENELLLSLKKMNNGSAPGSDGITIEFLKFFWSRIKHYLYQSFSVSLMKGNLSISQRSAIITLIHKGKDLPRNEMKNWRPISLTNSDYKLLAKCLALRMNNVIHSLINPDQVGYIKGRQVSTLLRLTDDVIDQMNIKNKPGILATIDMFHAFDCISKEFMLKTFTTFGFGPVFVSWVELLMKNTRSCVNYAGWLSSHFSVDSGIRQGCPFSPLAFVLALELLAIRIRQSAHVKGLPFDRYCNANTRVESLKLALYADDVTLFLADRNDLNNVLFIFRLFRNVSGLELNPSKCEAMWLGSNKNRQDVYHEFKWKKKIKILGVYFSNDKPASNIEDNYTDRIAKIKRLISTWEKRDLSIMGKIIIVKTFLMSQLVYFMQAFIIPDKVLTEINRILFRFVWKKRENNKKAFEKVKRIVLCKEYKQGGLKMIDIKQMQTSFTLNWVIRLTTSKTTEKVTLIPRMIFSSHGPNFACFHSNVSSKVFKGLNHITSSFWSTVLKTWLDNNRVLDNSKFNPMLWNNKQFSYGGNILFFRDWAEKGLVSIHDIISQNVLLTFERVCEILGRNANRIIEYNIIHATVGRFINNNNTPMAERQININDTPMFCDQNVQKARQLRNILTSYQETQPCSINFWKRKLNYEIKNVDWCLSFDSTTETRLRVLQWKLLHNIYPTNIMLCKMQVQENNFCSYCQGIVDYIEHFFFYCPIINQFWKEIEMFVLGKIGEHIRFRLEDIIFGFPNNDKIRNKTHKKIVNKIILIGKMCISIYKKTKATTPIFYLFERQYAIR